MIGPGALGTFMAALFAGENELVLLGRREMELEQVEVRGRTNIVSKIRYSTDLGELEGVELGILCTKSYDTRCAMEMIHGHMGSDTSLLSLQNGLNNEAVMTEYLGDDRVMGGVTTHGFMRTEDGKVVHTGTGYTVIGRYPGGVSSMVDRVAGIFNLAGLPVEVTDNIYGHIWNKVIVNSGINPLTALTGLKNGEVIRIPHLQWLMETVCREGANVARHEVELTGEEPAHCAAVVARATAENVSSMLQDVRNRRRTEIDCINGAIIEAGARVGVETPFNRCLYSLVKALESSYL